MAGSICDCERTYLGGTDENAGYAYAHEAVKRARDDQRAIPIEMYGGHIVEVCIQRFGTPS
jgi:hypothetical protein